MNIRKFLRAVAVTLAASLGTTSGVTADRQADDFNKTLSPYFVVDKGEPGVDTLPLKSTRADIKVSGVIADVRVTQVYRNEGPQPIEARYVFPASTRAAVYAMRMRVADRVVEGADTRKADRAARLETAKREGKSASLLEQQRPNVFSMSIANVMPGDEIAVDLRYTETVIPTDGIYRLVFPTVVGPRYNGAAGRRPSDGRLDRAADAARGPGGQAHGRHRRRDQRAGPGPGNAVAVARARRRRRRQPHRTGDTHFIERAREQGFRSRVSARGTRIASGVLLHEGKDENFLLAMIEPPARVPSGAIVPREYVFVLDVSGSMHGFPIETAKTLLRGLVANLKPTDTFNIIPFAGGHSLYAPQ